jgi:hypothetical protein
MMVEVWSDHRIGPGEKLGGVIDRHLESADIILLLVSPDFLNSDYCYDIEMKRAMERHERGEPRVIPVILRPCDWQSAPFGKLKAIPSDGKPITKHQTLDDAFLDIARAIRSVAQQLRSASTTTVHVESTPIESTPEPSPSQRVRSSNLRVRQVFTDRQRHKFLDEAFEYVVQYFEGSLAELDARNPDVETSFKRVDMNQFEAAAYMSGQERSRCGIWLGDSASILLPPHARGSLPNGHTKARSTKRLSPVMPVYVFPIREVTREASNATRA